MSGEYKNLVLNCRSEYDIA